jgi:phosphate transport system permease protein
MISRRKLFDRLATGLSMLAIVIAIVPLAAILFFVAVNGLPAINLAFFTGAQTPPGTPGAGILNAIQGSVLVVALASLIALPIGMLSGIYISEYGKNRFGAAVRFTNEVLVGIPSIVTGVFVYSLIVLTTHQFSAYAGGVALGLMMIPIVSRTTEESVKLVPNSLREASMALGIEKWKTLLRIVLSTARKGVITGIILAVARVAGETAPLLMTALGNNGFFTGITQPVAALPLIIYNYALSPYADWHLQAWGTALVLLSMILVLNIVIRYVTRGKVYAVK